MERKKAVQGFADNEELLDLVAEMLARRWTKSDIKKSIYEINGGKCSPATCEKILRNARDVLRKKAGVSHEENLATAIEFYESVIRDEDEDMTYRMQAQQELNKIYGLYAQFSTGDKTPEQIASVIQSTVKKMQDATHKRKDSTSPPKETTDEATDSGA